MSRVVTLHGGPYHGHQMELEDGTARCFKIAVHGTPLLGHYSVVAGYPHDFEWDGLQYHE